MMVPSFAYKLYNCDCCFFHTNNKKDHEKHLTTTKHCRAAQVTTTTTGTIAAKPTHAYLSSPKIQTFQSTIPIPIQSADANTNTNTNATTMSPFLCLCGKHYKSAYGLKYHKRKCTIITPEVIMSLMQDNKELRKIIIDQNKILVDHNQAVQQQLAELIPKIDSCNANMLMSKTTITNNHTTQNNFNLNIFLNEKCKDALNMSDFISSLKVTIDDLLVTREHGLGESIGRILTHGLSTMDVYKRPIHCTDLKRDTMYVKDKEIWEKDEQNMKIKQAIDQLSYKQMITIDDWRHDQPDIAVDDELQLKYSTILLKVLTDPDEKNARKIIRLVGKETFLDKDVLLH
jgi:hypothetical protein